MHGVFEAGGHHDFIDERIFGPAKFAPLVSHLTDLLGRAVVADNEHFKVGFGQIFTLEIILQNPLTRFALGFFAGLPRAGAAAKCAIEQCLADAGCQPAKAGKIAAPEQIFERRHQYIAGIRGEEFPRVRGRRATVRLACAPHRKACRPARWRPAIRRRG